MPSRALCCPDADSHGRSPHRSFLPSLVSGLSWSSDSNPNLAHTEPGLRVFRIGALGGIIIMGRRTLRKRDRGVAISIMIIAACFFTCAVTSMARAAELVPSAELLAAARKEGKVVLYTANFLDTEQAVSKRF